MYKKRGGKGGIRKDAHEAYPEIRIEEVFLALFKEKGVNADEVLVRHAGQFFRILSIDHLRLYDGTEEMLSALACNSICKDGDIPERRTSKS